MNDVAAVACEDMHHNNMAAADESMRFKADITLVDALTPLIFFARDDANHDLPDASGWVAKNPRLLCSQLSS